MFKKKNFFSTFNKFFRLVLNIVYISVYKLFDYANATMIDGSVRKTKLIITSKNKVILLNKKVI